MKRLLSVFVLCACIFSVANLEAAKASKGNSKGSNGSLFGGIDWLGPMVSLSGGYIFVTGDDVNGFLDDTEYYYGSYSKYDSGKGGLTVNLDILWDMKIGKAGKSAVDPGTLYAGLGFGFLQAANATWYGEDPDSYGFAEYGDYEAGYFVIPFEIRAKYYLLTKGLFVKAGLGFAVEDISFSFTYPNDDTIDDDDSDWTQHNPAVDKSGTGAGFICSLGVGYDYEVYKDVFVGGGIDGYFYFGKIKLISANPKICVTYKF